MNGGARSFQPVARHFELGLLKAVRGQNGDLLAGNLHRFSPAVSGPAGKTIGATHKFRASPRNSYAACASSPAARAASIFAISARADSALSSTATRSVPPSVPQTKSMLSV